MCRFDRYLLVPSKISPLLRESLGHVTELLSYLLFVRTCRPRHRQMARESFLWRATGPWRASHAPVHSLTSHCIGLPACTMQTVDTVVADLPSPNQASAFGEYSEQRSDRCARLNVQSSWAKLMQSAAAQIAAVGVWLRRGLGRHQPTVNVVGIRLCAAQCDRGVRRCAATVSGGPRKAHATVPGPLSRYRSTVSS